MRARSTTAPLMAVFRHVMPPNPGGLFCPGALAAATGAAHDSSCERRLSMRFDVRAVRCRP